MKSFWLFLWKNRTRTFGSIQGLLALFIASTDIFSINAIKWLLFINAVLTYILGEVNKWLETRAAARATAPVVEPPAQPPTGG